MKKIKRIISLMLSTIMCCTFFSFNVSSDEYSESDVFYSCTERIECFNEKYGTRIAFDELDESNKETLLFYSQMTDEEFEEYFLDATRKFEVWINANRNNNAETNKYGNMKTDPNYPSYTVEFEPVKRRTSPNVTERQRYFYNGATSDNSLDIIAEVNYSGGWGVYLSGGRYETSLKEYPGYVADSCNVSINSYYGYWVNLNGGSEYYVPCDFIAGRGDVYKTTSV